MYHLVNWDHHTYWWRGLMGTPASVSCFFVSSGFLLTYTYAARFDRDEMNYGRFWLARSGQKKTAGISPAALLNLDDLSGFSDALHHHARHHRGIRRHRRRGIRHHHRGSCCHHVIGSFRRDRRR